MVELTGEDKKYIDNTKTEVIPGVIFDHIKFLDNRFGEGSGEKVIKEMASLGYDLDVEEIKNKYSVPASLFIAFLVVGKRLFDMNDEDMRQMGKEEARFSFILRFISRFLVSLKTIMKNCDTFWKKYFPEGGEMCLVSFEEEERKIVVELSDFVGHPDYCRFLEGYITQLFRLASGKEGEVREEGCYFEDVFNQDKEAKHRFVINW